jgi:hypothetical protein
MSKQVYIPKNFSDKAMLLIKQADLIIREYVQQGYRLTVRQLYYQLVARGIIENTERSYKKITVLVNDAKLAGYLDWDAIEDRTREFIDRPHWTTGAQLLESAANQFHMDMWEHQDDRVFVIVEKEALVGVLQSTCRAYDVPLLAARGYPSGTVLREFCKRDIQKAVNSGQHSVVIHLGDHDPSGLDMTRDLEERINLFNPSLHGIVELRRIALTWEQIQDQSPPPNPAKTTDSRFSAYANQYGDESWELDALSPTFLNDLVISEIEKSIDQEKWDEREEEINTIKDKIVEFAEHFDNA